MIKNIIFDIGNVILKFNHDYLLSHFYQGEHYELLKEKVFFEWELLDEGKISLSEHIEKVLKTLPKNLHGPAKSLLENWDYYMHKIDSVYELIFELKQKGYKLYVLSNMPLHFIERINKYPIFAEFDGLVFSAPINLVKPNPKIYEFLLNKYSLVPEETLFIDDTKKNLDGASRFNIKTFLFSNNVNELKNYILTL